MQDIKQECFDYTSKYRAQELKNEVFLFNPFSTRTHRYNPFTYKFFSQQAQNLFIGLCYLYKDLTMTSKGKLFIDTSNTGKRF